MILHIWNVVAAATISYLVTHNQGVDGRSMLLTLQRTGMCAYLTGDVSSPRSGKFYLVQLEGKNTAVWEKLRCHRRPRHRVLCWDCKEQFSINLYCSCWSQGYSWTTKRPLSLSPKHFILIMKTIMNNLWSLITIFFLYQMLLISVLWCSSGKRKSRLVLSQWDIRGKLIRWHAGQNKWFSYSSCQPFIFPQFKSLCLLCQQRHTLYLSLSTICFLYKLSFFPLGAK